MIEKMREIIFKGKRTDNGEWVYGYYLQERACDDVQHIIVTDDGVYFLINPKTLCQYTGVTDKDGKKIFERDIIKYFPVRDDLEEKGVIQWDKIRAGFIIKLLDGAEDGFCKVTSTLHRCEVIGNVHDNPNCYKTGEIEHKS